jgi:hypothetical protein
VFHALLQRSALGVLPRGSGPRAAVEAELSSLLSGARQRLAGSPGTAHFADLSATLDPVAWRNAVEQVLTIAENLLANAPDRSGASVSPVRKHLRFEHLGPFGRWPEVVLESSALRLSGRADMIVKRRDGRVRVIDFKTGRVLRRKKLLPHLVEQLLLYALVVCELSPGATVELTVRAQQRHSVDADAHSLEAARDRLVKAFEGLPPGGPFEADDLSSVGPACTSCRSRHVCRRYLQEAPGLWKTGANDRLPADLWGQVESVASGGSRGWAVNMRDAAGRMARIEGLDGRHSPELLRPGQRAWFFGLAATMRPIQGRWMHPRNFHELSRHSGQPRAWSLTAFTEE